MNQVNVFAKLFLCWYIFVFLTVEIFSYFNILQREWILLSYIPFLLFIGLNLPFKKIVDFISSFRWSNLNILLVIILSLTFIQGFFSAPSTTDSMVYHLPRVMYWIQEQTVYQNIIRNPHDFMAPFAEYVTLHLYLVINSDRLLFLSQWLAYIVSLYLSYIIARQLGVEVRAIKLIVLFVATLPIALMQSVSTQVDLIVTVLVLLSIYFSLVLIESQKFYQALFLGAALGLGILTKATFLLYLIVPFGILLYGFIKNRNIRLITLSLVVVTFMLFIPLRFFMQNIHIYGTPLGEHVFEDGTVLIHTNEQISLSVILSNVLRNIMVQVPVPIFTTHIENLIGELHKALGIDVSDPRSTCCDMKFKLVRILYPQEDIVSNTLHLILIIVGGFVGLRIYKKNYLLAYIHFLVILSFLLFSVVLKWQPYHSRLEIPFFIIGTVSAVGLVFESTKLRKALYIFSFFSIIIGFSVIVLNVARPYISYSLFFNYIKTYSLPLSVTPESFFIRPRMEQYFNARFYWYEPYDYITNIVAKDGVRNISLELVDGFEYPIWVMLHTKMNSFTIHSKGLTKDDLVILSTTEQPFYKAGYKTQCFKTEIEYGYACYSKQE